MILRRITANFRRQDWTAVVVELMIVVLGVFIGLQASNWNEAREQQIKGDEVAQRLLQDLRVDLRDREQMVAYYRAVDASAEKTVALLNSPAPDPKALVVNAYRASEFDYYATTRATWDEVISAGELGILPHRLDIRDMSNFFTYDGLRDDSNNVRTSSYRLRVRRIIPHAVQEAIRGGCSDQINQLGFAVGFKTDCQLAVSDTEIAAAATALRKDPDLLPDLQLHFSVLMNARNDLYSDGLLLKHAIASFGEHVNNPGATSP